MAAAALSKAAAAAAGVGKTLGLKATPRSRGPGHYLMVLLAPIGALAVFAGLALALSQRVRFDIFPLGKSRVPGALWCGGL